MTLWSHLSRTLLSAEGLEKQLEAHVSPTAQALLAAGVEPATLESLAELLARWGAELGATRADAADFQELTSYLVLPEPLTALAQRAFAEPLAGIEVAALAIHLLDVAERLALLVLVPELPSLSAKAERTGEAARSVGLAKHLKG